MRAVLLALFVTIELVVAFVAVGDLALSAQRQDETAVDESAVPWEWPSHLGASDPDAAVEILSRAARDNGVNVLRTSIGRSEEGRTRITQFVHLTQESSAIFGDGRLSRGRWLTVDESHGDRATVSNAEGLGAENVGVPRVVGDRYELTFAPLRSAYDTLPVAGRYAVEGDDPAAIDRFLDQVARDLRERGLGGVTAEGLLAAPAPTMPHQSADLGFVVPMLMLLIALLTAYQVARQGKRIGVLRTMGWSGVRIWLLLVGRDQILVLGAGAVVVGAGAALLPGATGAVVANLLTSVLSVALVSVVTSVLLGVVLIGQVRVADLVKGAAPLGKVLVVAQVGATTVAGAVFVVALTTGWQQLDQMRERLDAGSAWAESDDFAVFYPRSVGDDLADTVSGGEVVSTAVARDLYPALERDGALFVDATIYEPGNENREASPMRFAPPILIGSNYLEVFPILDSQGRPVEVDDDETAWTVAVPETFRDREDQIVAYYEAQRRGEGDVQGAVQGQEDWLGEPVPDELRRQDVRIIWTRPGQRVFTFNTAVNPTDGNTVVDPILEIMTPANSMTVDRMNAVTGDVNTALKVRVDGDSQARLAELAPVLEQLHLTDNLTHLVTGQEAMLRDAEAARTGAVAVLTVAAGALVALALFVVSLVVVVLNGRRRAVTVRRLHGFGFVRTYGEVLALCAGAVLAQGAIALVVVLMQSGGGPVPGAESPVTGAIGRVGAVIALTVLLEAALVAVAALTIERRTVSQRLKEL